MIQVAPRISEEKINLWVIDCLKGVPIINLSFLLKLKSFAAFLLEEFFVFLKKTIIFSLLVDPKICPKI